MNDKFLPKWVLLPESLRNEIVEKAKAVGAWKASDEYATRAGMNQGSLYERLRKTIRKESWGGEFLNNGENHFPDTTKKADSKERDLTKVEKEFLKKLETGEMTFEETSRFVAVRVFERMLKNPDRWQYLDFFRTELIKVKREEAQIKDAWAKEIIGRMFSGKLPPKNCPECGHDFMETKVVEGQVVENGQKRITPSL